MFVGMASAVVALSFLLRIYQINGVELWIDEAMSLFRATTPGGLRPDVVLDPSPPLYYFLLRIWVHLAGTDEGALRLLSAVCGSLFVLLAILAGRKLLNSRVGLWSGVFASAAPVHLYYSQEARPYALLVTLVMLTMVLLQRAIERDRWIDWTLASVAGLLALFTHYFAILALVPAMGLVLVFVERSRINHYLRRMTTVVLACGGLYLPWVWWAWVMTPHSSAELNWIQPWWQTGPPALMIPKSLEILGLGGHSELPTGGLVKIFPYVSFPPWARTLGLVTFVVLGMWVAVPWMDDRLEVPCIRKLKVWLWAMLFVPLVVLWIVSLYRPVYVLGRYDLLAFPAFTLLVGLGMAKAQIAAKGRPVLFLCLLLAMALPIAAKLSQYYEQSTKAGPISQSATAQFLASRTKPGDVVVFTGLRGTTVLYYLKRLGFSWSAGECVNPDGRHFGCRMFPLEIERAPGTYDTDRVSESPQAIRDDLQVFLSALSQPDGVMWLVFGQGSSPDGRPVLPEPDLSFMAELVSRGFQYDGVQVEGAPGIFRATRADHRP